MKKCTKCGIEQESKSFYSNKGKKDGLHSECKECFNKRTKNYRQTENGKKVTRKSNLKYRKTEKGKISEKKKYEKYCNSEKGKIVKKRKDRTYRLSSKGRVVKAKIHAKRIRELGFILINTWFKNCEMHHLNKIFVLAIPKSLHRKYPHNHNVLKTMEEINHVSIAWYYSY